MINGWTDFVTNFGEGLNFLVWRDKNRKKIKKQYFQCLLVLHNDSMVKYRWKNPFLGVVLICKPISSGFCKGIKKFRQTLWINYDFSPWASCIVWCIHPKHWAAFCVHIESHVEMVTPWCVWIPGFRRTLGPSIEYKLLHNMQNL